MIDAMMIQSALQGMQTAKTANFDTSIGEQQRMGWNFLKLRRVIWRVKKYNNLEPTPLKEQVLKLVTGEYQTLKQISRNFQDFSIQWIYEILERLASEGCIEKKPTQKTVGKKKTYEMLYRLPQTNQTIASKFLVTNRTE